MQTISQNVLLNIETIPTIMMDSVSVIRQLMFFYNSTDELNLKQLSLSHMHMICMRHINWSQHLH